MGKWGVEGLEKGYFSPKRGVEPWGKGGTLALKEGSIPSGGGSKSGRKGGRGPRK